MRYLYVAGMRPGRVMHIERFTASGTGTFEALCGRVHGFNRSINAPWGLGRRICKFCRRKVAA